MAGKRASYRNPFISSLLCAGLYFIISGVLFWVFHGKISFTTFFNFDWVPDSLGTIAMGICILLLEFLRNAMGKEKVL